MLVSSRSSATMVAVLLLSLTTTNFRAAAQQAEKTCQVDETRSMLAQIAGEQPASKSSATPQEPRKQADAAPAKKPATPETKPAAKTETTDKPSAQPQAKEQPESAESEKPATGPDAGDKALGEGPDALAQKFAEILAKGLADVAKSDASPETPQPVAKEQASSEAASEPAPAAAEAVDEPPTISVLILRNPDELADVPRTERIGRLILSGDDISNRSLRGLEGLSVSELSIEAIRVSNVGLQYVKSVKGIRRLRLWSPAFDDEALKYVAELPDLQILDVEGTAMEGAGLEELKGLLKLDTLVLGPLTSDSQMASLQHLSSLATARFARLPKTDAGVSRAPGSACRSENRLAPWSYSRQGETFAAGVAARMRRSLVTQPASTMRGQHVDYRLVELSH